MYKRQALVSAYQRKHSLHTSIVRIFNTYGSRMRANDGRAVSYTHLRAHETVLDLVCRLLLEKKKTKPQETHYD